MGFAPLYAQVKGARAIGTVSVLERGKPYGRIRDDDGQLRFFHRDCCAPGVFESLAVGDRVCFTAITHPSRGLRAEEVTRADG